MWIPVLVFALLFVATLVRDPRRMRCALLGFATLVSGVVGLIGWALALATAELAPYLVLAGLILVIGLVVVLGVMLILNGFTMTRREGRRLGNLLGGALGLVMVAYVALALVAVVANRAALFLLILCLGVPLAYLGFGFVAYLAYGAAYLAWTRRRAPSPDVVVVLGCGLIGGRVPPLLAGRLDEGLRVVRRAEAAGTTPVLVVSGGQGDDEPRSEAAAMAEYLAAAGEPAGRVRLEDRSRTTKENIAYTTQLLTESERTGVIAAVTNNFHAFRAALILSRAKLRGYAVGARTAGYYWPAAVIREYAAILRDSLAFVLVCLGLSLIPLVALGVAALVA